MLHIYVRCRIYSRFKSKTQENRNRKKRKSLHNTIGYIRMQRDLCRPYLVHESCQRKMDSSETGGGQKKAPFPEESISERSNFFTFCPLNSTIGSFPEKLKLFFLAERLFASAKTGEPSSSFRTLWSADLAPLLTSLLFFTTSHETPPFNYPVFTRA